ncbi:stress response protein nst1-like isoform X1 [Panicum virgatum]|uniref:Uncharacterized protein n=1 Tax=Panicum virgatum TaxID=38727 RepID=A0A8T0P5Z1_PANVG|nr:stress response protein nst1-like isoform X1 [Panicum virgatum]KAG2555602.1 hypothetical protein PVAP13_8NG002903 [Panicum virgatum]
MCPLCSVHRWSRRVATMLPWLVIPLIAIWAITQLLLPAAYRFEVTSPRLACVSVLLLTLFWYEILLPRLSLWRARRSARLREERRAHALELHKLRKTATRRCRNCSNPYRDQNPGGGKFMCSYCGHVSKRPVLDLNSAGKVPIGWPCSQDCGCWLDLRCSSSNNNSFLAFSWRLLSSFSSTVVSWFLRKIFRFTSSGDGEGLGPDGKRLAKRGENVGKAEESRVVKARRKAEEKRLARLEREMLEEEERKQREEMAKLVEERRRLRDEKAEAEERSKSATPVGEKDARREAERWRQERRKKEDKGSSKSNSDCEDIDRRLGREGDRKREFDRKTDLDKREGYKPYYSEPNSHTNKTVESRTKYFGRMTGGFLSSSRGFGSGSFFGRSAQAPAPQVNKVSRPVVPATDQGNALKRETQHTATQATAKSATAGETRNSWANFNRPVSPNVQPHPTSLKKSWHQLFSGSASVSPCPDVTTSDRDMNRKPEPNGAQISNAHIFVSQYPPLESKPCSSQSMQFPGFPPLNGASPIKPLPHFPAGHMPFYDDAESTVFEEPEQFEDPCYDPDAIALLGPVSESLDNFPSDLDCGFISSDVSKESHGRPSPIESPLSRSRTVEEKPIKPPHSSVTKGPGGSILPEASSEQGTWQMWSTPLVQETLGLQGPQSQWLRQHTNQFNHSVNLFNSGTESSLSTGSNDNDPWLQKAPFQQLPPDTPSLFLPHEVQGKAIHNDLVFGSSNKSAREHPFGPPGHSWPKEELVLNGAQEATRISSPPCAHVGGGGLFSSTSPDVQSVWSFNEKETA